MEKLAYVPLSQRGRIMRKQVSLNLQQSKVLNRIIHEISSNNNFDFSKPQIQKILKEEFFLDDNEIADLEIQINRYCELIMTSQKT
jgi:hypothetical protein